MRLIDADALVQMPWVLPNRMTRDTALECFRNIVSEAPTIDAEPVRHGRWVKENIRRKSYLRLCTACGKIAYFCGTGCSYKYCPHCGAKMDGGSEDA